MLLLLMTLLVRCFILMTLLVLWFLLMTLLVWHRYHLVINDATDAVVAELPSIIAQGHRSLKVFMYVLVRVYVVMSHSDESLYALYVLVRVYVVLSHSDESLYALYVLVRVYVAVTLMEGRMHGGRCVQCPFGLSLYRARVLLVLIVLSRSWRSACTLTLMRALYVRY